MSVAHDVSTRYPATDTTGFSITTGVKTFSHAASADAKGVVIVFQDDDFLGGAIGSVSYGGRNLTNVVNASDSVEAGRVAIWFLGDLTGLGGTQTVSFQQNGTGNTWATCSTVTAATSTTANAGSGNTNDGATANPSLAFTVTAEAAIYGGVHGGAAAPTSYAMTSGHTLGFSADYGQRSARSARKTTTTTAGGYTFDFSFATADDWCIAAMGVKEVSTPNLPAPPPRPSRGLKMIHRPRRGR